MAYDGALDWGNTDIEEAVLLFKGKPLQQVLKLTGATVFGSAWWKKSAEDWLEEGVVEGEGDVDEAELPVLRVSVCVGMMDDFDGYNATDIH